MSDDNETEDRGHVRPEPPAEEAPTREQQPPASSQASTSGGPKRLMRSRDDRVVAGVAGGLGRHFDVDPVIVRIAFAVSIVFGGVGLLAYAAAWLFVPADDTVANPVPAQRGRAVVRALVIVILTMVALGGFGTLVAAAAFVTGIGYGLGVVAVIVLIGIALVALSFRGGAKWLIVPALALAIGVGVAAAADLDLGGGIGKREYRPASAGAVPDDGYELGVGRLAVDLRDVDWSPTRVVDLDVRIGVGEAVVAVPSDVCVVADAHAGAGDLRIVGQRADGVDVDAASGEGSTATPRLVLHADADIGAVRVLNDDSADITDHFGGRFGHSSTGDDLAREANARACAG